jgi:hypothetical protein
MTRVCRLAAWLSLELAAAVWAGRAGAAIETRVLADDLRIEVDREATAVIEESLVLRVQGGTLRSFDLPVGTDVEPLGGTLNSADRGGPSGPDLTLQMTAVEGGLLRLGLDAAGGASKGAFALHLRYRKDLRRSAFARRDGAMARIAWTGARWNDGLDNARCTLVVPAGPTAPLVAGDVRVRRGAGVDEIEFVRPHVARGEGAAWEARIDPRAFDDASGLRGPAETKTPAATTRPSAGRGRELAWLVGMMFGFSALVGAKARRVRAEAQGIATPRTLIALPTPIRVLFAGPALAAGVAMQASLDSPWWGTLLVAVAMALAAYRHPTWLPRPRGPGRWLPVADADAFDAPQMAFDWRSCLDASTRAGKLCFSLALIACAGAGFAVSRTSAYAAYLVLFDSAALFPIFGTGLRRDLPPEPARGFGRTLGRLARELRKAPDVRVIAWAHVPAVGEWFDEVRLLCVPRRARAGLTSVEIGVLPINGAGGRVDWPEVLVRVVDASASHRALATARPDCRWILGRKNSERVLLLRPTVPTIAMTVTLARRVLALLQPDVVVPIPANSGNVEAKSAGSDELTSNDASVGSPLQAM